MRGACEETDSQISFCVKDDMGTGYVSYGYVCLARQCVALSWPST